MIKPASLVLALTILGPLPAQDCGQELPGAGQFDDYGRAVAVHGDWIFCGATQGLQKPGAVHTFERTDAGWVERERLVAFDEEYFQDFGAALALGPDVAFVGVRGDDDQGPGSGSVYHYAHDGASWIFVQKLQASDAGPSDFFGSALSLDGDRLAVTGGKGVYLFERVGGNWVETEKLTPSDSEHAKHFGSALALHREVLVVGAPLYNRGSGAAYCYERAGGQWTLVQKMRQAGGDSDYFGAAVAVQDDLLAIGAPNSDLVHSGFGAAFLYRRSGGEWELEASFPPPGIGGLRYGEGLALADGTLIVGEVYAKVDGVFSAGMVHLYRAASGGWEEFQRLHSLDPESSGNFGLHLAADSRSLAVGAYREAQIGGAYAFELACLVSLGERYCTSLANSTGLSARLYAHGSADVSQNTFSLTADYLPPQQVGVFLASQAQDFVPFAGGSQGILCLGAPMGRFVHLASATGALGRLQADLDLQRFPPPLRLAVAAGETWNFQAWYTDDDPGPTSNWSDGISVTFE